jgi:hypothetical protein
LDAVTKSSKICIALGIPSFIGLVIAVLLYALAAEDRACHEKGGTVLTEKIPTREELRTEHGMIYYDTATLMKWCIGPDGKRLPE